MISLIQLTVSRIPNLKSFERSALASELPDAYALRKISQYELQILLRRPIRIKHYDPPQILKEAEDIFRWIEGHHASAVCLDNLVYPAMLREIFDPPYILYYFGTLPSVSVPAFGIVGTRKALHKSEQAAFRLGFEAARLGIPVISGLAAGIDFAAQTGAAAAEAFGGTWSVLGSGIGRIYPAASSGLARRIVANGGGIISEFPPLEPPLRWHFPSRNRIISGLSRAVCIIEAPERSGSLITADYALEQGRDVYIHHVGLKSPLSDGTKRLAEEGAPVLSSMHKVCSDWGWDPGRVPELNQIVTWGPELRRVKLLASGKCDGNYCRFQNTWYKVYCTG
jgi:DNA processing protein